MSAIFGDSFLEQRNKNVGFKISKTLLTTLIELIGQLCSLGDIFLCIQFLPVFKSCIKH